MTMRVVGSIANCELERSDLTTERWTDERLDRLAEAIESTRALVDVNAEAIAQLTRDADADRTLILEMMRYLYEQ